MGKSLWNVEMPKAFPRPTMVVGIDVCHMKKKKSIVGFVASCDPNLTKYYS